MNIIVENTANISNSAVRFIKWKIYRLEERFKKLLYANVHIRILDAKTNAYEMVLKLGLKGNDIIIKKTADDIYKLYNMVNKTAQLQLANIHK
jgi:ribosome-associated translation inhibitor RaiA